MTPQERLRKHQRALEKTQRELDRERVKLENQEKKLVQDIKKSAKNGQMGACKIQAKDLVRTRRYTFPSSISVTLHAALWNFMLNGIDRADNGAIRYIRYIQKFYSMRTQLQAISLRIQTVRSNEQMMQSMKGATSLLGSMNRQMNLPALQRIAMEFEKENDIMDQRQEMMDDAIDDVTGLEDEEEGEEVVKEVLDEIGVDLGQAVCSFPFHYHMSSAIRIELHQLTCALFLDGRNTLWPTKKRCARRSGRRSHRRWGRSIRRGRKWTRRRSTSSTG